MLYESISEKVQHTVIPTQVRELDSIENSKIKIIIPLFNEEKSIESVVLKLHQVLSRLNVSFEILVIDDGSVDNTKNIIANLPVTYRVNKINRGKAFSLLRGFHSVRKDEYVVTIDGDGEHCPEDLPSLLIPALLNKADVVIGSRFLRLKNMPKGSYLNNHKKFSHLRKLGNWLFSGIFLIFTRNFITDSQSGYRVYRPGILKNIKINSQGFMIETEIATQVLKNHYRVLEVPVHNGIALRGSYMNIISDSAKIICTILKENTPKPISSILALLSKHF